MKTLICIVVVLVVIVVLLSLLSTLLASGSLFPVAQDGYQILHDVATGGFSLAKMVIQ